MPIRQMREKKKQQGKRLQIQLIAQLGTFWFLNFLILPSFQFPLNKSILFFIIIFLLIIKGCRNTACIAHSSCILDFEKTVVKSQESGYRNVLLQVCSLQDHYLAPSVHSQSCILWGFAQQPQRSTTVKLHSLCIYKSQFKRYKLRELQSKS